MYLLMKASRTKQNIHLSSKTYIVPTALVWTATAKYHKWGLFLTVAEAGRLRLRYQYDQGLEKSEAEADC